MLTLYASAESQSSLNLQLQVLTTPLALLQCIMASGLLASQMTFSGESDDPYAAEDFLSRFEAFATAVNWNDITKKANVGMFLTGTIKDWYKTTAFADWQTFCTEFTDQHARRFSADAAEAALQHRKKLPSENFHTYYYDVLKLLRQAGITDAAKSVKYLMKGLTPGLATQLLARKPTTTADVLEVFEEWEELQSLMGMETLSIATATTPKEPLPQEAVDEILQLKHTVRKQNQLISKLTGQPGSGRHPQ